jgi:hypothetical protein
MYFYTDPDDKVAESCSTILGSEHGWKQGSGHIGSADTPVRFNPDHIANLTLLPHGK